MLKVKKSGAIHSLAESADLPAASAKTISISSVMPNIQVLTYGQVVVVRCSANTKANMKGGKDYTLSLGVNLLVGTATIYAEGGLALVNVGESGVLTFTPVKDISAGHGINFEIIGIMAN